MFVSFFRRPSCAAWKKYVPWFILACSLGAPPKTLGRQVSLKGVSVWSGGWEREGNAGWDLQMAVEVDDGYRAIFSVDGTQKRECDSMVSSKSDQARKCFAFLRWAGLVGMCVRWAAQK
jgi:hypothetical protein